jgi:hypothetical protein
MCVCVCACAQAPREMRLKRELGVIAYVSEVKIRRVGLGNR